MKRLAEMLEADTDSMQRIVRLNLVATSLETRLEELVGQMKNLI